VADLIDVLGLEGPILDVGGGGIFDSTFNPSLSSVASNNTPGLGSSDRCAYFQWVDGDIVFDRFLDTLAGLTTTMVGSFRVKVGTLQDAGGRTAFFVVTDEVFSEYVYFGFDDTKLCCWVGSGNTTTQQRSASTISAGTEYVIDFRRTFSGGTLTVEWKIDGVTQTNVVKSSSGATGLGGYEIGTIQDIATDKVVDHYFDDLVLSKTSGDYPLGAYNVKGYRPGAVGTHNLDANPSSYIKHVSGAATALTPSETTSYQAIDDSPLMTSDPDYIRIESAVAPPSAAPVVAGEADATGTNGGSISAWGAWDNAPSVGDLVIVCVYTRATAAGKSINTPAGWGKMNLGTELGTGGSIAAFYRVWQAGDTLPNISFTGYTASNSGDSALATAVRLTGADTSSPIGTIGTRGNFAASTTTVGAISGITAEARSLLFVLGGRLDDTGTASVLTGESLTWTERADLSNTAGSDNHLYLDTAPIGASNTAIAAKSFALSGASSFASAGIMFTIKGAPSTTEPSGANYAEYLLEDSAEAVAPTAIKLYARLVSQGTGANDARITLVDGGITDDSVSTSIGSTSAIYKSKLYAKRLDGSSAWTDAAFDALKLRLLSSGDATPDVRFHAITVEAAFPSATSTPVSASDASGSATEGTSLVSSATVTDTPGSKTETATPVFLASVSDTDGTETEAGAVQVPKAGTDTDGTETEATALTAQESASDADGANGETTALAASASVSDADGANNETVVQTAQLAGTDTDGSETEATQVTVPKSSSDAQGASTEATSLAAALPVSDADGANNELTAIVASLTGSDVDGTVTEVIQLTTAIAVPDALGSVAETAALTFALAVSDTLGPKTELGALSVLTVVSDADGANGETGVVAIAFAVTDSGSDSESGSVQVGVVFVNTSDAAGTPSEVGQITGATVQLTGNDATSAITELATPVVALLSGDVNGPKTELAAAVASLLALQTGSGLDLAATLQTAIAVSQSGAGSDTATMSTGVAGTDTDGTNTETTRLAIGGFDSAAGVDLAALGAALSGAETSSSGELADMLVSLAAGDLGAAEEIASVVVGILLAAIKTGNLYSGGPGRLSSQGRPGLSGSESGDVSRPSRGEIL